ncbi:hypothetical protein Pcinc_032258 [Petrolisthes cinctipes]|uniref:Uncharacterized protein n=1 Tax=Petrolisthes cinctipes TaxID=88211 RepID=A0AAE1K3A3_PETCI|nr:hypothetical protein Pcinc_032258 [Petrolisthes cinctipes]
MAGGSSSNNNNNIPPRPRICRGKDAVLVFDGNDSPYRSLRTSGRPFIAVPLKSVVIIAGMLTYSDTGINNSGQPLSPGLE